MNAPALIRAGGIAPWGWALIALRLALMLVVLVVCVPLYYLYVPLSRHNPVPRAFLHMIGMIAGMRMRMRGTRPARDSFFLSNHVSWLDIPALAGATGTAFVAHDGLARIGPLRWLCELNDTVFIARHDRTTIGRQIAQIRAAMAETGALTVFPEGTCSDGTSLLPFKSSLLSALEGDAAHIPVQPVWLDYGPQVSEIAWVGEEPGLTNALRILSRLRPVELTVHFLPPLNENERADRKRIAVAARTAIDSAIKAGR